MAWTKLVDLELDDEDKIDTVKPIASPDVPDYPWGLRICLTHKELEKLGMEADCEVGDYIDLRAFGVVTSVSISDHGDGKTSRVEIQLQKMAVESET